MKKVFVNLEMDIKRNAEYIMTRDLYHKTKQEIRSDISNPFYSGKSSERNYSIRHDAECTKKDQEYLSTITDIQFSQHEKMYNEMLELKKENLALRKALKENNISVTITHLKFYGENEEMAI